MNDLQVFEGAVHPFADNVRIEQNSHPAGGTHLRFFFENGLGASIIRNQYSYGGSQGLFELGLINAKGNVVYGEPVVPHDVEGYLTSEAVVELLKEIAVITPRELE